MKLKPMYIASSIAAIEPCIHWQVLMQTVSMQRSNITQVRFALHHTCGRVAWLPAPAPADVLQPVLSCTVVRQIRLAQSSPINNMHGAMFT